MVTISRDWCGYAQCWDYVIEARVPHEWASENFNGKFFNTCGYITTAYKDVTLISISENHPNFKERLSSIITLCVDKEDNKISEIENKIEELYKERNALIDKTYGKNVKRKCRV